MNCCFSKDIQPAKPVSPALTVLLLMDSTSPVGDYGKIHVNKCAELAGDVAGEKMSLKSAPNLLKSVTMYAYILTYVSTNLFAHTVASMKLHLTKKQQSVAYIYMFKTFPTLLMLYRLCVCVQIIGTASWTALLLWRQVIKNKRCTYSLI